MDFITAIIFIVVLSLASCGIEYAFGKGNEPVEPCLSSTEIFVSEKTLGLC